VLPLPRLLFKEAFLAIKAACCVQCHCAGWPVPLCRLRQDGFVDATVSQAPRRAVTVAVTVLAAGLDGRRELGHPCVAARGGHSRLVTPCTCHVCVSHVGVTLHVHWLSYHTGVHTIIVVLDWT
jgi:hypothetical protein